MAELKPLKITLEGVDKVLQSTAKVQKDIKEIQRLAKEKNNIILNDSQALDVLRKLKNEADNVDKGMKFSNFKSAMGQVKNAVAATVAAAVIGGKSVTDTVNDIGQGIAGVAASFGPYGVAIGAAVSLVTPLVASLFDASETQKALNKEMEEGQKASAALGGEIGKEIVSLLDLTSVIKSNTSTSKEKKEALAALNEEYKPYLESLDIALVTTANLEAATLALTKAIISNAIASAARAELEKTVGNVVAKNLDIIKLKNKQDKLSEEIQRKTGIQIDRTRILTAEMRREIVRGGIAKNADAKSVRELITSYRELENQSLLTKGNLGIITNEANEMADAFTNLDKNIDLSSVIGWVEKLSGTINGISTKKDKDKGGSSATKYTFQNIFGDDFDEIADSAAKVIEDLTFIESDVRKNVKKLAQIAEDEFTQATGKNAAAAQKLIDDNKIIQGKLNAVNAEIAADEIEINKRQAILEKSYGAFIDRVIRGQEDLTGLSQQTRDNVIKIATDFKNGTIDIAAAVQELSKDALGGIDLSGGKDIRKQADAFRRNVSILEDEKKKLNAQIVANDLAAQKAVDTGALQAYNTKLARIAKIEKDLFDNIEKRNKALAKKQIDDANAVDKALFEKGLLDYEAYTAAQKAAYEKSRDELADSKDTNILLASVKDFNDQLKKELNITEDLFVFDKQTGLFSTNDPLGLIDLAADNSKLKAFYQQTLKSTELNNKLQLELQRDYQELVSKRADIFSKQVGAATAEDYEFEVQKLSEKNGELIKDEKDYFDKILAAKSEYNKRRKKANIKQTAEEKAELQKFLDESLTTLQQSYQKQLEIDLFLIDKQIARLKLLTESSTDSAILKQIEDLEKKKVKLIEKTSDAYEKEATRRTDAVNGQNDDISKKTIIKDAIEVTKALQGFSDVLLNLVNQNSKNIIDGLNEQLNSVEQRTSEALNRIASLEDDLEGKRSGRREAVLQALEQQRDIERQLANEKIALAERIEEEEKKIRKRSQAAAIANAIINGAIAQTNIWATVPKVDFGVSTFVLAGISAATTAAQVALIAGQKFASGGFTGSGSTVDETGHKVAGVVHNDEWVAPKWMVESPKFGSVINQLEGVRQKGFAEGGFTSPDFNSLSQSASGGSERKMESMIKSYFDASMKLADRPIYTRATEVSTVVNRSNQRRNSTTVG